MIDVEKGIKNSGSVDAYMPILKTFLTSLDEKTDNHFDAFMSFCSLIMLCKLLSGIFYYLLPKSLSKNGEAPRIRTLIFPFINTPQVSDILMKGDALPLSECLILYFSLSNVTTSCSQFTFVNLGYDKPIKCFTFLVALE